MRKSCLLVLVAGVAMAGLAVAGGGGGIPSALLTSERPGQEPGKIQAAIRLQPLSFALQSVASKYRLIPIELRNDGEQEITLSAVRDQVRVFTASGEELVAGLDLAKLDRAFWDSLDSGQQNSAAYPEIVPAGAARLFFAYVPAKQLRQIPARVDVRIASVDKTLELRAPPAMAN
jgi:hypothetical protein